MKILSRNYFYPTSYGTVRIVFNAVNNRFDIVFNNEELGSYPSPQSAASDASGGHTFSNSLGVDLADLNIPEDLTEWHLGNP